MKLVRILLVSAVLVLGTAVASAQNRGGQQSGRRQFSVEDMAKMQTERVAENLKLNEQQKEALYKFNLEQATIQMKEREEQMKRQQERVAAQDAFMKSVLDESQYKKWQKQQQQAAQNRPRGNFGGGQGGFGGGGNFGGEGGGFGGGGNFGGGGFGGGMGF